MNAVGKPHTFHRAVYRSRMPLWETKPSALNGTNYALGIFCWLVIIGLPVIAWVAFV